MTLERGANNDLIITLPNDEVVTITRYFDASYDYVIDQIIFADGFVMGWQVARDRVVAAQKAAGLVEIIGSELAENYVHTQGDGSYTILDRDPGVNSGNDTLTFVGVTSETATFVRSSADDLIITLANDEMITIKGHFLTGAFDGIERFIFDDVEVTKGDDLNGRLSSLLIEGTADADQLIGKDGDDALVAGAGDDFVTGGLGEDTYVFAAGDGADILRDAGDGTDAIVISGYTLADASFSTTARGGEDLIIMLGTQGDQITVINGLTAVAADRIENVVFVDDGITLSIADINAMVFAGAPEGDRQIGDSLGNTLTSTAANDTLIGLNGNDTYVYAAGNGDDIINDVAGNNADRLELVDLNIADIAFVAAAGESAHDLVIRFTEGRDRITIIDGLRGSNYGVETLQFADGTEWGLADLRDATIAYATTDGDDVVRGFATDDSLSGGLGNDSLYGGSGNDVYSFARGDGLDRIEDTGTDTADRLELTGLLSAEASVVRLYKGSDTVVLKFATSDDEITLVNLLTDNGNGVEEIVFGDGVIWTRDEVLLALDNNAPVAQTDGIFSVQQEETLILDQQAFLSNDFDADGDTLMIIAVDGGASGVAEIDGDGNIRWTPNAGYFGPAQITYSVSDGQNGISEGVADIRVTPLASAKDDEGFTVGEDGELTISVARLLSNDLDGDRMVLAQTFDAQNGTVELLSNGDIVFRPTADFNGLAQFTYAANTPEGGRAEAVVYINVTPENDDPVARDDRDFVGLEDQPFTISLAELVADDIDIDGDSLTITSVTGTADVQVSLTDDGFVLVDPSDYFFGNSYFEYVVSDGNGGEDTGRVSLRIDPVNNAPEPHDDMIETAEDNPILISADDLLANDIERDGDTLTIISVGSATGGRVSLENNDTILFTPDADFFGNAGFSYTVDDGQGGFATARVAVNVTATNDAPHARADSYRQDGLEYLRGPEDNAIEISIADLLANDRDVEGDAIKIETFSAPLNGDIEVTDRGTVIFTPDEDYWGSASFNYVISDEEGLTDGATVTLYFDNVGDAPPVAVDDVVVVREDVPQRISIAELLANDTDIDRDVLSFVDFSYPPAWMAPLNGTIERDGDYLVFTPDLNADMSSGFFYTVTDNADGTDTGFVDIQMIPINDDPLAGNDAFDATPLDLPLVLRISDIMANDTDIEDNPINFAGITATSAGVAEIYNDEFVVVRFDAGFTGDVDLTYEITDPELLSDEGFITASVAAEYEQTQTGTDDRDLLIGNMLDETIYGGLGNDDIFGEAGVDTIFGGEGDDTVFAGAGADIIDGGIGDDTIDAGEGDDHILGGDGFDDIDGGEGFDTVDLAGSNVGVRADLAARIGQGGFAQGDVYTNVEALLGSDFGDELGGDAADNRLEGRSGDDLLEGREGDDTILGQAGDDTLNGGVGADMLDGGAGSDTVDYFGSEEAVTISLADGTATGGDATGDTLVSIENVTGSDQTDQLTGSDADNTLFGRRGDDVLIGGLGDDTLIGGRGSDQLMGGEGIDIADYSGSPEAVIINMANGAAGGGEAEGDTFDGIEIIRASNQDDTIIGDDGDNIIQGGLGADIIDGGAGFDTADYSRAFDPVVVNLAAGQVTEGAAQGDTLSNIEMVIGSSGDDTFIGSDGADVFDGGFGNDKMSGGGGSDTYLFGFDSTNDTVTEAGLATDVDRVQLLAGVERKDVSIVRDGNDMLIELERDDGFLIDTLRVTDHFVSPELGIEEIVFDSGLVWDRSDMDALSRAGRFNAEDDLYRFGVEDEVATIQIADLLANDAADGVDGLTVISVQNGINGTATLNDDGTISFLGDQDFNSTVTVNTDAYFDYTVADEFGRESTAEVRVNIDPVNDAPTAENDGVFVGTEDTILQVSIEDLLSNDFDIDGDNLSIVALGPLRDIDGNALYAGLEYNLTNGKAQVRGDFVNFEPRPDHSGFAGFIYTVSDGNGGTATAEVELFFNAVNDAPRGRDDSFVVRLSQSVETTPEELLANDFDIEGDTISFIEAHSPTGGTLVIDAATGAITFTPDALGSSSFLYDVRDEFGETATLTVNVSTRPLNDAPDARDDSGFETLEDQIIVIDPADLLLNDTDPNDDILVVSGVERFPENGTVRFNDDGMIEFTPLADFNGLTGFVYAISDGQGGTDEAFVEISVIPRNDAPVLFDDITEGFEDLTMVFLPGEAFGNDYDPEGDVLFFESVSVLGVISDEYLSDEVAVTASLIDGSALPAWMSFDDDTLTFTGTMPADQIDPISVSIDFYYAEEDIGFTREMIIRPEDASALVTGLTYDGELADSYKVRAPFSSDLELSATDLDPTVVATAVLADGTDLPDWLAFDPITYTLSGTVPADQVDALDVVITLTQPAAEAGMPALTYDVPVVVDPAEADAIAAGLTFDADVAVFDISNGVFEARLANYRALPEWLAFNAETMELTLTDIPPAADADVARVQITFNPDDEEQMGNTYESSDGGFSIEFVIDPAAGLNPSINAMLQNDAFFAAQDLFAIPLQDAGDITAAQQNMADLPDWMAFDDEGLAFTGTPPALYVGALPVRLDVAGSTDGNVPNFSIITDVVVDESFTAGGNSGFGLTVVDDERIILDRPEDFNGAYAFTYTANDGKDGISEEPAIVVVNVVPLPETPDTRDDVFNGTEDELLTFSIADILANDKDDDGDPIRVIAVEDPGLGTLEVALNEVTLPVPADLPVLAGGTYSAVLAEGGDLPDWMVIDTATGEITATVPLDVLETFDVVVTVTDGVQSDSATVTQLFDGNEGVELTYTPEPAYSGPVNFGYEITDDAQGNDTGNIRINLAPVNDPPVARDDRFDGVEFTPLTLSFDDLLANDRDIDGDALTITSVFNAENGTVGIVGNTVIFSPQYDWDGVAIFEYVVSDNGDGTDIGLVRIDVESTNDAPVVVTDTFVGEEDVPFIITRADILGNDTDAQDDDIITLVRVDDGENGGQVFEQTNGDFQILSAADFNGVETYFYTVTDGRDQTTGFFTVDFAPVNDAPAVFDESGYVIGEDTTFTVDLAALLLNDEDVEGDALTIDRVFDGVNGTVEMVGGQAVFTPRADYFGNAGFSYAVQDTSGAESIGFVSLFVTPEDDLPIAGFDSGFTLDEDTSLNIDPADLLLNDFDPDGGPVSFVGFAPSPLITDLGNGLFEFTPVADANGAFTVGYQIADAGGAIGTGSVRFDVTPVVDAPEARDDVLQGTEDVVLSIFATELTDNDSDADGSGLIIAGFESLDGVTVALDGLGRIIITPEADRDGEVSLDYILEDPTGLTARATVTINLAPQNDVPVVGDFADLQGTEDEMFMATLDAALITDVDTEMLDISVRQSDGSALPTWLVFDEHSLTFAGTPPQDLNGTVNLELVVFDGANEVTQPINLTIDAVNDAPVAADDAVNAGTQTVITIPLANLLANDTDVEGDTLTITAVDDGLGYTAALDGSGNVVITRDPRLSAQIEVTYTVSDGDLSSTGSVMIDLEVSNQAPVIAEIDDILLTEDSDLNFVLPEGVVTDPDGDPLTLTVTRAGGAALPDWLRFDANTRALTGTPPANFNGVIALELSAADGFASDTQAFNLIFEAVNDAPEIIAPFSDRFSAEDEAIALTLQSDIVVDVDGDALTYAVTMADGTALPDWVSFDPATLALTGTPPTNFNGVLDLQVTVTDGTASVSDVFSLNITAVNDAPELLSPLADRTTDAAGDLLVTGSPFVIAVPTDQFADVDGDPLAFASRLADGSDLPSWMNFDGVNYTGTAPRDAAGAYAIVLIATDGTEQVGDIFTLTFEQRNTIPVASDDGAFTVTIPDVIDIDLAALLANDSDLDGDTLSVVSVTNGTNGEVVLEDDFLTYIPELDFRGDDQFTYTVTDGFDTATATVNITVENPFDNVVDGGDGNDSGNGGNGDDLINGGEGNDTGNGGNGDDTINGGEGNDTGNGGNGDDTINGGSGNDTGNGGNGNDTINGGDGNDTANGGNGNDTVDGGNGDDRITGGNGNDRLNGGAGTDVVYAGNGNDILNGGAGNDGLYGGNGDDIIGGGAGNDTIFAGNGDDTITGGTGDDRIYGGSGQDSFFFAEGDGSDIIYGFDVSRSGRRSFIEGDQINLSVDNVQSFDDLLNYASQENGGVLFDFGDGDEIFLSGTQLAALDKDQFSFY